VRSIHADWERGDYSHAEWAHPEIDLAIVDGPSPGHWTGVAGMAEGSRSFLSAWERYRVDSVQEYRELDDERVLVLALNSGRGKSSGVELGQVSPKGVALFCIRGGKVTRLAFYWDRDRALADLGLEG
jgi:hypothetical protein